MDVAIVHEVKAPMEMTLSQVAEMIKGREVLVLHVYKCPNGFLTCGWGHKVCTGDKITQEEADRLWELDFQEAVEGYRKLGLELDPVRRAVIIDMIFNLGLAGVRGFKKMLAAVRAGDFDRASQEILDSKYSKVDHEKSIRDDVNANMMRTGVYHGDEVEQMG